MDPDTDDCRQLIEEEGGISITYRLSDPDTDDCPQLIEEEGGISITYRLRDLDTDDCPQLIGEEGGISITYRLRLLSGAPNGNIRENICSENDLRTRIFGTFVVKFLASLSLLGFSNI